MKSFSRYWENHCDIKSSSVVWLIWPGLPAAERKLAVELDRWSFGKMIWPSELPSSGMEDNSVTPPNQKPKIFIEVSSRKSLQSVIPMGCCEMITCPSLREQLTSTSHEDPRISCCEKGVIHSTLVLEGDKIKIEKRYWNKRKTNPAHTCSSIMDFGRKEDAK